MTRSLGSGNLPQPDPDAVHVGVYGTVFCGFGPALACYPWNDPDLRLKTMIVIDRPGARVKAGDTILGARVTYVNDATREIRLEV